MQILRRLLGGTAVILLVLILILVGSIAVDALIGRGRLAALTNTEIDNPSGPTVAAYVARPEDGGFYPAVIMIHEFWGLNQEIVDKAELLAEQGYVVIAPDTYRGRTTGWIPRAITLALRTPVEQVNNDLDAVFRWLAAQPEIQADRVGVLGFCYGGGKALRYSLHNPGLAATVILYGDPIDDPEQLQSLRAPVLGIFGEEDAQISVEEVERFEAALEEAGVPHAVLVYPGVGHAFVSSVETILAGGPPGEAWLEILAFLQITLQDRPQISMNGRHTTFHTALTAQ